jgi:hypothetical protein
MMTSEQLKHCLEVLRISPQDAATFLGVAPRTFRRWTDGEEIPGPAAAALDAWVRLANRNLAWKPDSLSVFTEDKEQIDRQKRHAEDLATMLSRVEQRGGPKDPWTVDLKNAKATFGHFEVGFYTLANGSFSLSSVRRKDEPVSLERDWEHIEDAAYWIAVEFSKMSEVFDALKAVVDHIRKYSHIFAVSGSRALDEEAMAQRKKDIEAVAGELETMMLDISLESNVSYRQFEVYLNQLQALGFFPTLEQVSAVARAFHKRTR